VNEQVVAGFLTSLRRVSGFARLYGPSHPLSLEAAEESAVAGAAMSVEKGRTHLVVSEDSLFVDGRVLARTSLEFNSLLRMMNESRVHSVAVTPQVTADDIARFAALIAGVDESFDDSPGLSITDLIETDVARSVTGELRRSYTDSLDTLRGVGSSLRSGKRLDLNATADTVETLLDKAVAQPSAALLLSTVKSHHEYTFYHSVNTCILSLALGRMVGLDDEALLLLGAGALLHDIGKLGVSPSILSHPGRLNAKQWEEIRRYPQVGAEAILEAAEPGQEVTAAVAFEHHARVDGSGYPRLVYHDHAHEHGGRGPLHLFSRLVSVADTYDALTSRRSYRMPDPPSRALQIILDSAGNGYDPDAVHAFIRMMGVYPPGSFLRLRSGLIVMVSETTGPDEPLKGLLVRGSTGAEIGVPEPVTVMREDVLDQLAETTVGLEPTAVFEAFGAAA